MRYYWRVTIDDGQVRSWTCKAYACWTAIYYVLRAELKRDPALRLHGGKIAVTVEMVQSP